jgi:REP element-mobilizing transposase RayT
MARGIERRSIFVTDNDRLDFFNRLDRLVESGAISVYAFSLMPNHFHMLARTGNRPISRTMSSLLTGYAVSFNLRHERAGHLFQNRFKSILCEEAGYFRELVRYIHLNPVRAKILDNLDELDHDPTTGHAAILGNRPARFLDVAHVLRAFGDSRESARLNYRSFVAQGLDEKPMRETTRRGEVWRKIAVLAERSRRQEAQDRVLGSAEFLDKIRNEAAPPPIPPPRKTPPSLDTLMDAVAAAAGVPRGALTSRSKFAGCSRAREGLAFLWIDVFGQRGLDLAQALGIRAESVCRIARRGRKDGERWRSLVVSS